MVRSTAEKFSGESLSSYEYEFGECLYNIEVMDHSFIGNFFTWSNKRKEVSAYHQK